MSSENSSINHIERKEMKYRNHDMASGYLWVDGTLLLVAMWTRHAEPQPASGTPITRVTAVGPVGPNETPLPGMPRP